MSADPVKTSGDLLEPSHQPAAPLDLSPLRELSAGIGCQEVLAAQLNTGLLAEAESMIKKHPELASVSEIRQAALSAFQAVVEKGDDYRACKLALSFALRSEEVSPAVAAHFSALVMRHDSPETLERLRSFGFSTQECVDGAIEKIFGDKQQLGLRHVRSVLSLAAMHSNFSSVVLGEGVAELLLALHVGNLMSIRSCFDKPLRAVIAKRREEAENIFGMSRSAVDERLAAEIEAVLNQPGGGNLVDLEVLTELYPFKEGPRRDGLMPGLLLAVAKALEDNASLFLSAWSISREERIELVSRLHRTDRDPSWTACRLKRWIGALDLDYEDVRETVQALLMPSLESAANVREFIKLELPWGYFAEDSLERRALIEYLRTEMASFSDWGETSLVDATRLLAKTPEEQAEVIRQLAAAASTERQTLIYAAAAKSAD